MAPQKPTLDVVIYAYNHEEFIEHTLRSVFEQTVDFPVSIRVHDDASTDGTHEALKRLSKDSPFPFAVTRPKTNRYQDGSRFKHEFLVDSHADYLAVLDGDDYWTNPRKLALQVENLESNASASLCHHSYEVRRKDSLVETVRFAGPALVPGSEFSRDNFVGTSSVVLRRSAVPPVLPNGFNKVRGVDDWPIWALTTQNSQVTYIDAPMSVYRLHGDNFFANQDLDKKRFQTLMALVYITNSVEEVHQPLWLAALEAKMNKKTSLMGQINTLKRKLTS